MIKPNWDIFKAKFSDNPQENFEWFCYLLFCREFKKEKGIFRFKNQSAIETNPIEQDDEVIGWQAKFYETSLSTNKGELVNCVKKAKRDYPSITILLIYTNKEWAQTKGKTPKGFIEVENTAKELGIKLKWNTSSFFESEFVSLSNKDISKHFFCQDKIIINNIFHPNFPKELVNQKIEEELSILKKSRFYPEFDRINSSTSLANKLMEGELSGGASEVRMRGLSWCARLLSTGDDLDQTKSYIKFSKTLGNYSECSEIEIADAFLNSARGKRNEALTALAAIDTSISRSASFMLVRIHDGSDAAIKWLNDVGYTTSNLCPEGKLSILMSFFELGQYDLAKECVRDLTGLDYEEMPLLYHMVAMACLLGTVPDDMQAHVYSQMPFESAELPLASDGEAINNRRTACDYFIKSREAARKLNCPNAARIEDEYRLFLELRDPLYSIKARKELESKLSDPETALGLVHLGVQFGVKLDIDAVNREIDRQIALHGGVTNETALARFAIAFKQDTPLDVANYIDRYRDDLYAKLNKVFIVSLEIDMLSQARFPKKAEEALSVLIEEGISDVQEKRLRIIISEADGIDPIESLKEQFENSKQFFDLSTLVKELEIRKSWEDICHYGRELFSQTNSLIDAERLAIALSHTHKNEILVEFIEENPILLNQSNTLKMLFCWALYHEGSLLEARAELDTLDADHNTPNYRALKVNLGFALGDTNSLLKIVADECCKVEERSSPEILRMAELGFLIGSPNAKELLFAAANKADDDANILAAAYFLASSSGLEDNDEVHQWLLKAAELSGDDGPIKMVSLSDLIDQKPEWDRRKSEAWKQVNCGEIPMFLAGQLLNKSLCDFMLFPALANRLERDPRRRSMVPAYSGSRLPQSLKFDETVGIDISALLTLSFLDILDEVIDKFDTVLIPHSTLSWLFKVKQKSAFHQPSRIKGAHQIRDLLATNKLENLSPRTVPDSDLSDQIGEELALLIGEAERTSEEGDDVQKIVVRSSPVHRVGSLLEEEADLADHAIVLSSCSEIVRKLREKGQITEKEEKDALSYMLLHEKPWPNQPEITDAAIFYLDDLTITYFQHLGLLEKLKLSGFRTIISSEENSEINQLIAYENVSSQVIEAIEKTINTVKLGIENRKIKIGRQYIADDLERKLKSEGPTLEVITLLKQSSAIITDDRFFNQHATINHGKNLTSIISTLDIIDQFVSDGVVEYEKWLEIRTSLRRAGFFFIPVDKEELNYHLEASMIKEGKVVETAELKAIRENILQVRMRNYLQLPKEGPWLDLLFKTLILTLRAQWTVDVDFSVIIARSNWIMEILDIRGWVHCFRLEDCENIIKTGPKNYIRILLSPPAEVSIEGRDEYWSWLEEIVLSTIKEQEPELYSSVLSSMRDQIADTAKINLTDESKI